MAKTLTEDAVGEDMAAFFEDIEIQFNDKAAFIK